MSVTPDWADQERARLERVAQWYTNRKGISAMSGRATAQFIIANAKPGSRMLEMGCGKGVVTEILADRFPCLRVVEGSATNARMVRGLLGDRAIVHCALFEEFQPMHEYDDIVMGRMLGYVSDPDAVLSRAVGWLAPGGRIHIVVPNGESIHRRVGVALGLLRTIGDQSDSDLAVGRRRVFNMESLMALIDRCNLKVVTLRGTLLKPLSSMQMESWPEDLLRAFYEVGQQMPPEFTAEIYACCEVVR